MVKRLNVPGEGRPQQPADQRHYCLKDAKVQSDYNRLTIPHPLHGQPLTDRYGKGIHRQPHCRQQKFPESHNNSLVLSVSARQKPSINPTRVSTLSSYANFLQCSTRNRSSSRQTFLLDPRKHKRTRCRRFLPHRVLHYAVIRLKMSVSHNRIQPYFARGEVFVRVGQISFQVLSPPAYLSE